MIIFDFSFGIAMRVELDGPLADGGGGSYIELSRTGPDSLFRLFIRFSGISDENEAKHKLTRSRMIHS
jgi:hypothetical protein